MTIALAVTAGGVARGQQPTAPAPAPPAAPAPPTPAPARDQPVLKVLVVISRYQGDKKISSHPYTLSVTPNARAASIRMGLQVAVPASPLPAADGKTPPAAINYRDVGTSIDCLARSLDDGRFRLELTIDESSLVADDKGQPSFATGIPQFRSFRISGETAVLRDGQSAQLTSAAERVTGEVARVDVTLTVVK